MLSRNSMILEQQLILLTNSSKVCYLFFQNLASFFFQGVYFNNLPFLSGVLQKLSRKLTYRVMRKIRYRQWPAWSFFRVVPIMWAILCLLVFPSGSGVFPFSIPSPLVWSLACIRLRWEGCDTGAFLGMLFLLCPRAPVLDGGWGRTWEAPRVTRGARGQGVGRLIFEVGALYLGSSGTRASVNLSKKAKFGLVI